MKNSRHNNGCLLNHSEKISTAKLRNDGLAFSEDGFSFLSGSGFIWTMVCGLTSGKGFRDFKGLDNRLSDIGLLI
jgi:hypothetical protein